MNNRGGSQRFQNPAKQQRPNQQRPKQRPKQPQSNRRLHDNLAYPKVVRDLVGNIFNAQASHPQVNFSFLYDKMFGVLERQRPKEQRLQDKGKEPSLKSQYLSTFTSIFDRMKTDNDVQEGFKCFHSRRTEMLNSLQEQGYEVRSVTYSSLEPFVTGLGMGHVTETGIRLDRQLGTPYYPASSLKGAIRATAKLFEAEPTLVDELFGSTESGQGSILFFDAYPVTWPELKVDIMTPHYGPYYSGEQKAYPSDDHDPTPIPFLVVEKKTSFEFLFAIRKGPRSTERLAQLENWLELSAEVMGLGAKTAVGYGRFVRTGNR
ncbi:MAG TPA: type III-B CRISPR module RAMP protein Cmr6 [Bacilli bacterium]|nr:type III-B CRISPR module RAMP protein Cmr6 [Bacilli bacterium]